MDAQTPNDQKKARVFNLDEIFEQTKKTARELSAKTLELREKEQNGVDESPASLVDSIKKPSGMKTFRSREIHDPSNIDEEDGSDEDTEDEDDEAYFIPLTTEASLSHGQKPVSGMTVDPAGSRLVSGSYDFDVKIWDFNSMDADLNAFRTLRPCDRHQIKKVEFSPTGHAILVIAGNSQAMILDRDGYTVGQCNKGDQYLADMQRTTGHVSTLSGGCWNPRDKRFFLTYGDDCTIRIWDSTNIWVDYMKKSTFKSHLTLVKCRDVHGRKVAATSCTYSRDANILSAATRDGSIVGWDLRKPLVHNSFAVRAAHTSEVSCLCYSLDGGCLASRSDGVVKIWDPRNWKQHVAVAAGYENFYPMSDVIFSPNDKLVVIGTSYRPSKDSEPGPDEGGRLVFLTRDTLTTVHEDLVCPLSSVVRLSWHAKLNQMFVGTGNGDVKIFYDPEHSNKGAMVGLGKSRRSARQRSVYVGQEVITPYALPMFRVGRARMPHVQANADRKDPVKSRRPDLPLEKGSGGRTKTGGTGSTLAHYIASMAPKDLVALNEDKGSIRERILRHADEAEKNPVYVSNAYVKTQPNILFQEEVDEDAEKAAGMAPPWKKAKKSGTLPDARHGAGT